MTDTLNITTVDDPIAGFFRVMLENCCVAAFYYCTEGEEGMDRRILVKTGDGTHKRFPFYEFELVEETKHEIFVRYTQDEAIILFNYQPVLRIPLRYKLGDQEVDMCEEAVDWANQIVEDLNKTKNENESRTRKS